jgi:chaperonin GroEL
MDSIAVKSPGFGDRRKLMMEDLAILTGGKFISSDLGIQLENVDLSMLGQADRIIVTKDQTTIISGCGGEEAIKNRIHQLRRELEEAESSYDKDNLQGRLAKLSGGVAVIKVGAATETEMAEIKHRFEDALSATRAALDEGIVAGGGAALLAIQPALNNLPGSPDEQHGIAIVRRALEEPLRRIAENAGFEGSVVVNHVRTLPAGYGFDALSEEYCSLVEAGIVDPVKVTRFALEHAASIAGLILTTETVIVEGRPVHT